MTHPGRKVMAVLCTVGVAAGCSAAPRVSTRPAAETGAGATVPAARSAATGHNPASGGSFAVDAVLAVPASARVAGAGQLGGVRRLGGAGTGKHLMLLAVGPRGQLVAEAVEPADRGPDPRTPRGQVGSYGPHGFTAFPGPASTDRRVRETQSADTDGRTVAWADVATSGKSLDWRILGYDVGHRRTRLLGTLRQAGTRSPAGDPVPTVGALKVFWAAMARPAAGSKATAVILARAADGSGEPRTVVRGGKLPHAHGDDLYYVRSADVAPGFPADRYEIRRLAADGGDTVAASGRLGGGRQIGALAVAGDTVSWVVTAGAGRTDEAEDQPQDGRIVVWNATRNSALLVELADAGPPQLSADAGLLAWGNGSGTGDAGEYVLDVARRQVWRLHTEEGASIAFAGGGSVAWAEIDDSAAASPATYTVATWR